MTFFMIGGIVCVITACVLIFVYLLAHKMDEHSTASKIICWLGMVFGVAGAALMTIEYSFPNISHPAPPYVPTVYDHFVEFYGDKYYTFIKTYTEHTVVDEFIQVKHEQLNTIDESDMHLTLFKTYVLYDVDEELYDIAFMNKYEYNDDYSYQNVVSYAIK